MSVLGAASKAILGETRLLPVLVAAMIGAGVLLREIAPNSWSAVGGLLLLAGAVAILFALTRPPSRPG